MVSEFLAGRTSIPGSGSTLSKLAYRSVIDLVETSVATNANPRLVGAAAPPLFQLLSVLCCRYYARYHSSCIFCISIGF